MACVTGPTALGYGLGLDINAVFMPGRIVGQDGAGSAWFRPLEVAFGNRNYKFSVSLCHHYLRVVAKVSSNMYG